MSVKQPPGLILIAIAAAASIAYLAYNNPRARPHLRALKQQMMKAAPDVASADGGAYASSDRFLIDAQIGDPSETLRAAMADLSPDETILFVGALNDPAFTQDYLTISYLSWPRQIAVIGCDESGRPPKALFRPRDGIKIKRAMFYIQPPPAAMANEARAIGAKIKLIEVPEDIDWTICCSQ
jgi:hypothetical protein